MRVIFTVPEIENIIRREVNRSFGRDLTASTDDAKVKFVYDGESLALGKEPQLDRVEVEVP